MKPPTKFSTKQSTALITVKTVSSKNSPILESNNSIIFLNPQTIKSAA